MTRDWTTDMLTDPNETFSAAAVSIIADAYLECADWADAPRDENGEEEDSDGWADEVQGKAEEVVEGFIATADLADLNLWAETFGLAQIGHDLWLTAAHHGAGFWDRASDTTELGKAGARLTAVAHTFPMELYVGDDRLTYLT